LHLSFNRIKPYFSLSAVFVCSTLLAGFVSGACVAAESTPKAGESTTRFATVGRIHGEVTATAGENGATRSLRQNDPVFVGERIRAAGGSEALLKTDDAGLIAIRPQAEFFAEQFVAEGKTSDQFTLRLIKGGLRLVTGWIGRANPSRYKVHTITATIGVRGTDHEPYEMSTELAESSKQEEGTYDKVNRGGTIMDLNGKTLDIDPGKVGFARRSRMKTRALMTIVLPVLLEKVPDFYVPGQFEDELNRLSLTVDENALRELELRRKALPEQSSLKVPEVSVPAEKPAVKPTVPAAKSPVIPAEKRVTKGARDCSPELTAKTWLGELDAAILRRDASTIVNKFAPEVTVRVTVRGANGETSVVEMGRDELARSTIAAVSGLTEYQQRRPSIEGRLEEGGMGACNKISVRSVVIEQGRQNGKPYRFESVEQYVLERRGDLWLATKAEAMPR
jgi:hypothetical protein